MFGLPSSLAYPLFYRVAAAPDSLVPRAALAAWLQRHSFWSKTEAAQAFDILRQVRAAGRAGWGWGGCRCGQYRLAG